MVNFLTGAPLLLPSSNRAIDDPARYLQSTDGRRNNGGFGLVRENGRRFHGGLDIAAVQFDPENGEAVDPILAVSDGTVVYLNRRPERSSYGSYVVLEHEADGFPFLTIYAHLGEIDENLQIGRPVSAGQRLGTIGRTSNAYAIPRNRTHLHFEIALLLGTAETFGRWYDRQRFPDPNFHGPHNGLNWVSIDPLPILQAGENGAIPRAIRDYPTAFVTRVPAPGFPDFLRRYGNFFFCRLDRPPNSDCPSNCESDPTLDRILATRMDRRNKGSVQGDNFDPASKSFLLFWTWFGLPKYWVEEDGPCNGLELVHYDPVWLPSCINRGTLRVDRRGDIMVGERAKNTLEKIFGKTL